jgi:OFA family oxalate/formate antiporter-like MFS transporter
MADDGRAPIILGASCLAVLFPGALIFGFPGVLGPHWQTAFQVGRADIGQILFYVLAGAGLFMFLIGRLQEKIGPSLTILSGAVIGGTALILVSYAEDIRWVYFWAFVNGSASAFAYLPAMTVAQRWYLRRRGMANGLVSMCFGISGAVMAPLFSRLLLRLGYGQLNWTVGIAAILVGALAALLIRLPQSTGGRQPATGQIKTALGGSLNLGESLRTRSFWLLWCTYAFAGAAGISMVTLSVNFGLDRGLVMARAVLILTAFNITNGLSRFISGYLSDIMGRKQILGGSFLAAGLACFSFPHFSGLLAWSVCAALIGFSFGTLHSVTAPLVSDCFGLENFGQIFGMVFTAFGFVSGALGPWLSGFFLDATGGNFSLVFAYLGSLLTGSVLLIWIVTPRAECTF